MNITWDAKRYARNFSFVNRYGEALLDLVHGEGLDVLDLGCGEGALTQALADRGHHVTGMDASAEQIAQARASHPGLCLVQGDATRLDAEEAYDVVFSNAVLHWIDADLHDDLLARVRRALRPGGQFVFECGGAGCGARVHAALAEEFVRRGLTYVMPFYFPTIGEYAPRVERAGMVVRAAWLFDRPTDVVGEDGLRDWIEMFVRTPFEGVDDATRAAIEDAAVRACEPDLRRADGTWWVDYVRLRLVCERP